MAASARENLSQALGGEGKKPQTRLDRTANRRKFSLSGEYDQSPSQCKPKHKTRILILVRQRAHQSFENYLRRCSYAVEDWHQDGHHETVAANCRTEWQSVSAGESRE